MTKEKLQGIINLKNTQAIIRAIEGEGYLDMAKHPTLKKVSLVPIAQSKNSIWLDWINGYKYFFQAIYVEKVDEFPEHEFIWLQINKLNRKLDMYTPHIQRVFYKEK